MWMNEYEVQEAAERYELHPVLGPATRTLAALVDWTNANSDGWPYWRKPAQAAARLMELIGGYREYANDPDRPDVTMEAYKVALRPLKAFRTRYERDHTGLRPHGGHVFEIAADLGGPVWAATKAFQDLHGQWQAAQLRADALKELRDRAEAELNRVREREHLRELNARVQAGQESDERLIRLGLFEAGARIYDLPAFGTEPGHFAGLGQVVTVTGLSYGMSGPRLTFVTDDGKPGIEYEPMTVTEAQLRWWVLDADGANLVSGGHRDKARMIKLAADYPGAVVRQGSDFISSGRKLVSTS